MSACLSGRGLMNMKPLPVLVWLPLLLSSLMHYISSSLSPPDTWRVCTVRTWNKSWLYAIESRLSGIINLHFFDSGWLFNLIFISLSQFIRKQTHSQSVSLIAFANNRRDISITANKPISVTKARNATRHRQSLLQEHIERQPLPSTSGSERMRMILTQVRQPDRRVST